LKDGGHVRSDYTMSGCAAQGFAKQWHIPGLEQGSAPGPAPGHSLEW
jgi:hypothetical protein